MTPVYVVLTIFIRFALAENSSSQTEGLEGRALPLIVFDDDERDTECWTPDNRKGKCSSLANCPGLHRIRDLTLLRKYICGYENQSPMLCCPRQFRATTARPTSTTATTTSTKPSEPKSSNLRARKPQLLPDNCGDTNSSFTRVVGGVDAKKGDWPWQVLVLKKDREGTFESHCGGSLISHKHVLSASHCFVLSPNKVSDASLFKVKLGEHDLSKPNPDVEERLISRLITHENFEYGINTNDIAIMVMDREVAFTAFISPICLPYSKNIIPDDITEKLAYVTGWGRTRYLGKTANVLQMAFFPIWDSKKCTEVYKGVHIDHVDSKRFICAGDPHGIQDSCQGDSGGPLVRPEGYSPTRYYQVGIVSFGVRCATKGFPGVYTRLTSYLDWINTHV